MKYIKNSLAVSSLLFAFSSQAAMITQYGTDVSYTYDDSTAYGTGVVIGNNIFFTPETFFAESLDDDGITTAHATLNIDISATTSGFSMTNFNLFEDGDYHCYCRQSNQETRASEHACHFWGARFFPRGNRGGNSKNYTWLRYLKRQIASRKRRTENSFPSQTNICERHCQRKWQPCNNYYQKDIKEADGSCLGYR